MSDILSRIVAQKLERIEESRAATPLHVLRERIKPAGARGRMVRALNQDRINIIAEVKRRSPSKGVIRMDFDPVAIAKNYAAAGASAISILTEQDFFDGSLDYLRAIREVCSLPLLRKDFIVDQYQIFEAVDAEADAILLIAAILDDAQFGDLLQTAHGLGLDVLVEVHDLVEAERVLRYDVDLLGVNNRNLRTFVTDLKVSIDLAASLPKSLTLVSESGIRMRSDIDLLRASGYRAFLIGEEFMRSGDERNALANLIA